MPETTNPSLHQRTLTSSWSQVSQGATMKLMPVPCSTPGLALGVTHTAHMFQCNRIVRMEGRRSLPAVDGECLPLMRVCYVLQEACAPAPAHLPGADALVAAVVRLVPGNHPVGCMGVETWQVLDAECRAAAPAHVQGALANRVGVHQTWPASHPIRP